jgi:hypothetical protein
LASTQIYTHVAVRAQVYEEAIQEINIQFEKCLTIKNFIMKVNVHAVNFAVDAKLVGLFRREWIS